MHWIALSFSLPSGSSSSKRVAVWRRLQKLGSVSPTGALYLLPAGDESQEAFDWLAQEIEGAGGEALVFRIDQLAGDAEGRLVEAFRTAREEDYQKIAVEAASAVTAERAAKLGLQDLEKLRRRFAEAVRIDFFHAPGRTAAEASLARLEALLGQGEGAAREIPSAGLERYRGRKWVTRPHPHVDRLACAWLIRRFVDPQAEIRYAETAAEGEVSFDMRGAELGHRGNLCTFETMVAAFGLGEDPALAALAAIVHEIDLRDGASARPEVPGVDAILSGWSAAGWTDAELERNGTALFEGLYLAAR
jgi:uncharacterized protein YdbL (DUF1318 family)